MSVNLIKCFFAKKFEYKEGILLDLIEYVKDYLDVCMNKDLREKIENNSLSDFKILVYLFSIVDSNSKKNILEIFFENSKIPESIEIDFKIYEFSYEELIIPIKLILLNSVNKNSILDNIIKKELNLIKEPYLSNKLAFIKEKYKKFEILIEEIQEYTEYVLNLTYKQNELATLLQTINFPIELIKSQITIEEYVCEELDFEDKDIEKIKKIMKIEPKIN